MKSISMWLQRKFVVYSLQIERLSFQTGKRHPAGDVLELNAQYSREKFPRERFHLTRLSKLNALHINNVIH